MTVAVDDLLAAPVGVALLDRIEALHRDEFRPFDAFPVSDPNAIQRGAAHVAHMTFGELLALALRAAQYLAGPWSPGAPNSLAYAFALATTRQPIAEAICERFGAALAEPFDPRSQQCWLSDNPRGYVAERAFADFSRVYGNGEFTWDGFWTVTDPPVEAHDGLVSAWEMHPGPITRWSLPVRHGALLWTVDRPSDWVRLVETYPKVARGPHAGWELPGPSQSMTDVGALAAVRDQHALRTVVTRHILPDWEAVAQDYQGVHLSWGGFLTTEGYVADVGHGGVTMLRYWGSERTLWLADVFGDPQPLDAPELSGESGTIGLDASWGDDVRTAQDLADIATTLGR